MNDAALEFATRFGATDVVSARDEDASRRVRELTEGRGVDYAFEVFGSGEMVTTAFNSARRGGTVVVIGLAPVGEPVGIDASTLVRAEKTVKGSYYGTTCPRMDMYRMVDLAKAGKIDVGGLITRRYSLAQINQAYEHMESGSIGRGVIVF